MFNVMFSLMRDRDDVEDGYWQLGLLTESVTAHYGQMFREQRLEVFPGHLVRILGLRLVKVPEMGPLTIEIRDGMVCPVKGDFFDGIDRDSSGPVESGQSS
jgi:hypothetical protein